MLHAITTGHVKITQNWLDGKGQGVLRMVNTLLDSRHTDWLPIWCFIIEHRDGLIVVDTGIPENANQPRYFPPFMPLVQRAAPFRINGEQEIGPQMRAIGLNPAAVRYVLLTHLHQDHDGGLHHFPNAEFIVSRAEWEAAQGLKGRLGGYLNDRWPEGFRPTLVDYSDGAVGSFTRSQQIVSSVTLVPTPGHSVGHQSVIWQQGEQQVIFGGDVAYTQDALFNLRLDGVSGDLAAAETSMRQLRDTVQTVGAVFLPTHDPDSAKRLATALS